MKKQLLSILLFAGIGQFTSAQVYTKGNMSLFFGVGASNTFANKLSSIGEGASNSFGPYIIGYQFHLSDKLTIGLAYTNQSASTGKVTIDNGTDNVSFKTNFTFSTFLSQLNYSWYDNQNGAFVLYSGLSAGTYTLNAELEVISGNKELAKINSDISEGLAYHITAIGFKGRFTKTSKLGAFAELGYGYNGLFNGGIQYTFN
ncbi:MAG: hypothetical protein EBZ58_02790 [Bacteroidetes bacterium]|jgi:hypothetical protein|nr:hypothetical protein [Bacteroidota bacterium]